MTAKETFYYEYDGKIYKSLEGDPIGLDCVVSQLDVAEYETALDAIAGYDDTLRWGVGIV